MSDAVGSIAPASNGVDVVSLEEGGPNSVSVTHSLVGDEWTLWIIQTAMVHQYRRYGDWISAGTISNAVLSSRLARLVEHGIMERVPYQHEPPRYDYVLTRKGRQLWPTLIFLWDWERTWVPEAAERLPAMHHRDCGADFSPVLICSACKEPTGARDVEAIFGPSGGWTRSIPTTSTRRRSRSAFTEDLVEEALTIIGDRWSVSILGAAFLGTIRYGQFTERFKAPPNIVSDRLRRFCELGLFEKHRDAEDSRRGVYLLTEKAIAFYPVIATLLGWGMRWYASPEGPPLTLMHRGCGEAFDPRLTCSECREELTGTSVQVVRKNLEPHGIVAR